MQDTLQPLNILLTSSAIRATQHSAAPPARAQRQLGQQQVCFFTAVAAAVSTAGRAPPGGRPRRAQTRVDRARRSRREALLLQVSQSLQTDGYISISWKVTLLQVEYSIQCNAVLVGIASGLNFSQF